MLPRSTSALVLAALLSAALTGRASADPPRVVASIPPVHGIVAAVMEGVGTPHLLLPGGSSPHGGALKPSDARRIASADLVFWVSEYLETTVRKPISTLARESATVAVMALPGVRRLTTREGGIWQADGGHEDGNQVRFDTHLWLDADNAAAIARGVARALAAADPDNAAAYEANAGRFAARAAALDREIRDTLAPVTHTPYVVFHDAYQYFEQRYGLAAAGALTVSPERPPGIRRILEVRAAIAGRGARCVFAEPQFAPAIARTVIEGTVARLGVLDPLGAGIPPGPDHWFALMRGLATSLVECLGDEG